MAATLQVKIVDSQTIQISLPPGMSVNITKPVPPDFLEILAIYSRMQNNNTLGDAEGCGVQIG